MKHPLSAIVFSIALLGLINARAATITYQTRLINEGVNSSDYRTSWNEQTSVTTSQNYSNFDFVWGGNNTFSHLAVNFASKAGSVLFQIAPDAGFGGALYLDGLLLTAKQYDLWWGYDWNNSSQMLASLANLGSGNHILEVFWAENCCNGAGSGRYSIDGGMSWQSLSTTNLDKLAPVPVPAAIWLFGTGLIALVSLRRKTTSTELLKP